MSTFPQVQELDEAMKQASADRALQAYHAQKKLVAELTNAQDKVVAEFVEANKHLIEVTEGPWIIPGAVSFAGIGTVKIDGSFLYPPGPEQGKVHFYGTLEGTGVVAFAGMGLGAAVVKRDVLFGEDLCILTVGARGTGLWDCHFSRDNTILANYGGGGAGVGGGQFKGIVKVEPLA